MQSNKVLTYVSLTVLALIIVTAFILPIKTMANTATNWPGVNWIKPGAVISSNKLKDALNYLYNNMKVNNIPVCMGNNSSLHYDGSKWICIISQITAPEITNIVGAATKINTSGAYVYADQASAYEACKLYVQKYKLGTLLSAKITGQQSFYSPRNNAVLYFKNGKWNRMNSPSYSCAKYGYITTGYGRGQNTYWGCVSITKYWNLYIDYLQCSVIK